MTAALVVVAVCVLGAALLLAVRERGWPTVSIGDGFAGGGDDDEPPVVEKTPAIGFALPTYTETDEDDDEE